MRETAEREGIDLDRAGIQIVNARLSKRSAPIPISSIRACSGRAICSETCSV